MKLKSVEFDETFAKELQPVFKKTTLDNGVRVVTEHHPMTRASAVAFFVSKGSRDEPHGFSGAAHFVEHMVFKGTKSRSAFDIAKSLEAVGGELNAYTTKEYTCFHAVTLREHLPLALDVLTDLLQTARFSQPDFILEREVIRQEMDLSTDSFEEHIFDLYFERAFQGHSLGRPILGTKESLSEMTLKDLTHFYQSLYGGENLIVAVAGHVDHEFVVDWVQNNTQKLKKKLKPMARRRPKIAQFTESIERPSEQVHQLVGFSSVSFKSPLRFESYIVNALVGGGMTSLLYQKIREQLGLVYSVYSYLHSFTDSGLFLVYAGSAPKSAERVLRETEKVIKKLCRDGVKSKELSFYQRQVKGSLLLAADDIENRVNSIGVNEMVFGRYRPVEQVIAEVEAVSIASLNQYISEHLNWETASFMSLGRGQTN